MITKASSSLVHSSLSIIYDFPAQTTHNNSFSKLVQSFEASISTDNFERVSKHHLLFLNQPVIEVV